MTGYTIPSEPQRESLCASLNRDGQLGDDWQLCLLLRDPTPLRPNGGKTQSFSGRSGNRDRILLINCLVAPSTKWYTAQHSIWNATFLVVQPGLGPACFRVCRRNGCGGETHDRFHRENLVLLVDRCSPGDFALVPYLFVANRRAGARSIRFGHAGIFYRFKSDSLGNGESSLYIRPAARPGFARVASQSP